MHLSEHAAVWEKHPLAKKLQQLAPVNVLILAATKPRLTDCSKAEVR